MEEAQQESVRVLKLIQRQAQYAIDYIEGGLPLVNCQNIPGHEIEFGDFRVTPRFGRPFREIE